jgi:hypothetical protein
MEKAENIITSELAKQNVTDAVIAELKKNFLPLKINGIDDKEGYKKVHDARIQCRDIRILAEKICKKGREDAIKIQKDWISKEKQVVAHVQEVELHLKKQEDDIDAQKEAIRIHQERLLKLPERKVRIKGLEEFIGDITDDQIMRFDDAQWNEIIYTAQGAKLAKQQKEIDEANALAKMTLVAEREKALYTIAGAAMEIKNGIKTFYKGNTSISMNEIETLENDVWNIRFAEITTAKQGISLPDYIKASEIHPNTPITSSVDPKIEEATTDEEKLFQYALALEKVPAPVMSTEDGWAILTGALALLNDATNLLRQ